ncbi:hypothetical protein H8356DRAFT_1362755 [Neocallimastix lanati (nom. inval.)]|nr:hypothetical protein H8356DRAFT_1362755 [Neocallimastix sp. JGI-2020a]
MSNTSRRLSIPFRSPKLFDLISRFLSVGFDLTVINFSIFSSNSLWYLLSFVLESNAIKDNKEFNLPTNTFNNILHDSDSDIPESNELASDNINKYSTNNNPISTKEMNSKNKILLIYQINLTIQLKRKKPCIDTEYIENINIDKSVSNKDKGSTNKVNNSTLINSSDNSVNQHVSYQDNSYLMDDASVNNKSIKSKFSSTEESNSQKGEL